MITLYTSSSRFLQKRSRLPNGRVVSMTIQYFYAVHFLHRSIKSIDSIPDKRPIAIC